MTILVGPAVELDPDMLTSLLIRLFLTLTTGSATVATATQGSSVASADRGIGNAGAPGDGIADRTSVPRVAQVRLAETLAGADAIHSVSARGNRVTFTLTQGTQQIAAVATIRRGAVVAFAIEPASRSVVLGGGLSWLADELESATAITRLVPDEDGAVTITTDDGRRYMVIPGRGSGGSAPDADAVPRTDGNDAVSARWAAAWNQG